MPARGTGRGTRIHAKGYVQIIRRGPWRGWLEHRKVMLEMCRQMCYYPIDGDLPPGFTVDHLDHNRSHNCPENLMLLDKRIHDHLSAVHHATLTELRASVVDVPDWVNTGFGEAAADGGVE